MKKVVVALISFSLLFQPVVRPFKVKASELAVGGGVLGVLASVVSFACLSYKEAKIQKKILEGQFSFGSDEESKLWSDLAIIQQIKLTFSSIAILSSFSLLLILDGFDDSNQALLTDKKNIAIRIIAALGGVGGIAGIISTAIQKKKFLDQMEEQKENERSSQEEPDSESEFNQKDEAKIE